MEQAFESRPEIGIERIQFGFFSSSQKVFAPHGGQPFIFIIYQSHGNAGWSNVTEDPAYVSDCPFITVEVTVENRISQGSNVALTIAKGPLRPCATLFVSRKGTLEEMKGSLGIRVEEVVFNSITAEHARESRDAGRRFARFCNRRVNEEYQGSITLSKKTSHFQAVERYDKIFNQVFRIINSA